MMSGPARKNPQMACRCEAGAHSKPSDNGPRAFRSEVPQDWRFTVLAL